MHPDLSAYAYVSQRGLREFRKLNTKKGRVQTGQILIEGTRLISEAIQSEQSILTLLVSDDDQGVRALTQLSEQFDQKMSIATQRVGPQGFARLTETMHAAGVAAVVAWPGHPFDQFKTELHEAQRLLFVDRVSDPGNLGTLIRTAAGLGIDGIFLHPDAVELTNPKVVRATAGALFRLPIYSDVAPDKIAAFCQKGDFEILIADAHRGDDLHNPDGSRRWVLVIGGETLPLDPVWDNTKYQRIRLPLKRGVESLNAAVAGAIFLDRLCRGGA